MEVAYDVLGDQKKRAKYDRLMSIGQYEYDDEMIRQEGWWGLVFFDSVQR